MLLPIRTRTVGLLGVLVALSAGCVSQKRRDSAASHASLGVAYLKEGNVPGSVEELQRATKSDPRSWQAFNKLGLAYLAAGAPDRAEQALSRAARLAPDNAEVLNNYGLILMRLGRIDEAVPVFEHAIKDLTYRRPSLPMSNLGHALYLLGRNEEAIAVLDQAVQRAPNLCEARFNRGLAWDAIGKPGRALEDMESVVALCGDDTPGAYLEAGRLLISQSDRNGGCSYLLSAQEGAEGTALAAAARSLREQECK